jgi:hypothetical protein
MQAPREEVIRAGDDDDGLGLRPGPVQHRLKRHALASACGTLCIALPPSRGCGCATIAMP